MISTQSTNPDSYTKRVIQLSLPMAITQLIAMSSGFLCMTMLAKLGHEVLAASALIFSIRIAILITSGSLLFSLSIMVGHAFGERDYLHIGRLLQQGWLIGLVISIPSLLLYWYIYPILISFGQEKNIAKIVETFFHANMLSVPLFYFSICNQQLCYGVHKQRVDMLANFIGVFVLVISAYFLIFGGFGLPPLGVTGFGYANVLQSFTYFAITTLCIYVLPDFKKFDLFRLHLKDNWQTFKKLFKIGWPISLQITAEMLSFIASTTFIGWLGSNSLAAYQIIMQYQFLIVVPVFALAQASGILVGQAFGSKQFNDIKQLGATSLRIAIIMSAVTSFFFIFFPHPLASLYLDVHSEANQATVKLVTLLFLTLAFSQIIDAIKNVLTGTLRGLLDTKYPMIVGIICIWIIGLPLGYLLTFSFHLGVVGMMMGMIIGVGLGAILLYLRWQKFATHMSSQSNLISNN